MTLAIDVREAFRIHRFSGATSVALQGLTLQVEQLEMLTSPRPQRSKVRVSRQPVQYRAQRVELPLPQEVGPRLVDGRDVKVRCEAQGPVVCPHCLRVPMQRSVSISSIILDPMRLTWLELSALVEGG